MGELKLKNTENVDSSVREQSNNVINAIEGGNVNMEENNKNKSAMGIAGFVLGIISTLSTLFWYITVPTGVLAIIFGAKSSKKNRK